MRPKPPQPDPKSGLVYSLLDIWDTFLPVLNLEEFYERACDSANTPLMQKILDSGLIEAAAFPPVVSCPELVLECMSRYDPVERCIRDVKGKSLLVISRQTIATVMRIPKKEQYQDWTVCK